MALPEQGPADLPWHEDPIARQAIGDHSESNFPSLWLCKCDGTFVTTKDAWPDWIPGDPDYVCRDCGQLIDTKAGREAGEYKWLCISQRPFEGRYTPDTIIAWDGPPQKPFSGIRKRDAIVDPGGPFPPTHTTRPTWFHRISTSNFVWLTQLGLRKKP